MLPRASTSRFRKPPSFGYTPLTWAACSGHVAVAEMLIAAGAEVNLANNYGMTPLHWAARNGHLEVVQLLLRNGADKELKDNNGWKPVDRVSSGLTPKYINKPHKAAITALLRSDEDPEQAAAQAAIERAACAYIACNCYGA